MRKPGSIIFLNGASSSGKSTLARAIQSRIAVPFWHYSIDHYRDSNVLPMDRIRAGEFIWRELRVSFFDGFHASIPALVNAGNNVILEHIVEDEVWFKKSLGSALMEQDVFFVGVHCAVEELERRERARGDRQVGDARRDFAKVHAHCVYDTEIDSLEELDSNVEQICNMWGGRSNNGGVFRKVAETWLRLKSG